MKWNVSGGERSVTYPGGEDGVKGLEPWNLPFGVKLKTNFEK